MQQAMRVLQTVILAAGSGSRLAPTRGDVPKPLMTVAGVPLLAHALEHARRSGCDEAVIVVGYEGARVRSAIEVNCADQVAGDEQRVRICTAVEIDGASNFTANLERIRSAITAEVDRCYLCAQCDCKDVRIRSAIEINRTHVLAKNG